MAPYFPFPSRASGALVALALTSCSSGFLGEHADSNPTAIADVETPRSPRTTRDGRPIIGTVRLRDEHLVISASEQGPRFAVVTSDGAVVSNDLDEATLAARHAHLFQIYRAGYAQGGPYLDARLDGPRDRHETFRRGAEAAEPHGRPFSR